MTNIRVQTFKKREPERKALTNPMFARQTHKRANVLKGNALPEVPNQKKFVIGQWRYASLTSVSWSKLLSRKMHDRGFINDDCPQSEANKT